MADWTRGYFDELYLELFPFPDSARTDEEGEALTRLLPPAPAKVLDLACGQGRHAVRLAQRGYQMVATDTSQQFLEAARRSADELGVALDLVASDMREIAYGPGIRCGAEPLYRLGLLQRHREPAGTRAHREISA